MGWMDPRIQEVRERKALFRQGGGAEAVKGQHEKGKLTARERLGLLLDPGSFLETDLLASPDTSGFGFDGTFAPGDAAVTGSGKVNHRKVFVYAHDATVLDGSWGKMHERKVLKTLEKAYLTGAPFVQLLDSGEERPQEQHEPFGPYPGFARFARYAQYSGSIPQISLVMGTVSGPTCYAAALSDVVFMVKGTSHMFLGDPAEVKQQTGDEVSEDDLGGARIHATVSGVADVLAENDADCVRKCRDLLSYLPSSSSELPPVVDTGDDPNRRDETLADVLPPSRLRAYSMYDVITRIVDNGQFFEIKAGWARNLITCLARLNGKTVGILANNPMVLAGAMTPDSSDKGSRFIRLCDAYNIPVINLMDTPAYLVGTKMEYAGIIRHGSKMLYAHSEVTVPQISVVVRKCFAGGYVAMGSSIMDTDLVFAWPTAEFGLFGVDAGMAIILRSRAIQDMLAKAKDKDQLMKQWREEYAAKYLDIYKIGPGINVEDIIDPADTRPVLIKALEMLEGKKKDLPKKKHGNTPL